MPPVFTESSQHSGSEEVAVAGGAPRGQVGCYEEPSGLVAQVKPAEISEEFWRPVAKVEPTSPGPGTWANFLIAGASGTDSKTPPLFSFSWL